MPPKKHLPSTGELIYKQVGKKGRYKLVPVPKTGGPSNSQGTDVPPPPPTPSIVPPTVDLSDQNIDSWAAEEGSQSEPAKKSGKVCSSPKLFIINETVNIQRQSDYMRQWLLEKRLPY